MYEKEIAEAILTGRSVSIKESDIHNRYQESLNNLVETLKDNEFAVPKIVCELTQKICEYGGQCSTCIVALETLTRTSMNMEEMEVDLIRFSYKHDKKNGIEYMTTPSGRIMRFENMAQMLTFMGYEAENLVEMDKEDAREVIESNMSVYADVLRYIFENTEKVYVVDRNLVFEREGGSMIVFKAV